MVNKFSYVNRYVISRLKTHRPVIMTHMVTAACVCKCKICDNWRKKKDSKEMTTEEILGMLDQARDLNFVAYLAWGGEPLLRPDIMKILGHAHDLGLYTCLTTNGFFLPQKAEELAKIADLTWVSLDHYTNHHDYIRGLKGTFSRATEGIIKLRDAGGKIAINCVLTKMNVDCVDGMAELAKDLGVKLTFDDVEVFPGVNDEYALNTDESMRMFAKVLEYKNKGYHILNSRDFIKSRIDGTRYPCSQPQTFIKVLEDGRVTPFWCQKYDTPFGDLKKQSLGDILTSSKFAAFSRMAEGCQLCNNQTALESAIFHSPYRFFTNYYKIPNPYLDFLVEFGF
jgi:MoaA/NifB/PqqE/SkfB family radical SAM enzyme